MFRMGDIGGLSSGMLGAAGMPYPQYTAPQAALVPLFPNVMSGEQREQWRAGTGEETIVPALPGSDSPQEIARQEKAAMGTKGDPSKGPYSEVTGRGDPAAQAQQYQPGMPIAAAGGGATSRSQQTSTSVSEKQIRPEYELGIKSASERQQELEIQKADQAALAAKVLGIKSRISIAQREMRVNELRRQQLKRQDKLLAETSKLNKAYEAWGKKEVDQDRAWRKMTKGSVWRAAAIGALAGIGQYDPQTKSYKPGGGWAVIDRVVNRDIQTQKEQLGREGKALGAKRGLLGELRAIYKDQDQADLAHEAKTWDMAADTLKAWAAEMRTPQLQMEGLLNAQRAKQTANMKLAQLTQRKITTAQTLATTRRRTAGGVGARRGGKTRIPVKQMAKLATAGEMATREDRYIKDLIRWGKSGLGIKGGLAGAAVGAVAGRIPDTEARRLKGARGMILSQAVKSLSGVAARPDEIKRIDPNYPSFGDSPAMVYRKYYGQLEQRRSTLVGVLRSYPDDPKAPLFQAEIRNITRKMQSIAKQAGR